MAILIVSLHHHFLQKSAAGNSGPAQSSSSIKLSQSEPAGGKTVAAATQHSDSVKEHILKAKPADGRLERTESVTIVKPDPGIVKLKVGLLVNGADAQSSLPSATVQSGTSRSIENPKQVDESTRTLDENMAKVAPKNSTESELRTIAKRSTIATSLTKPPKQDLAKDDSTSGKAFGRTSGPSSGDKDLSTHASEGRQVGPTNASSAATANGNTVSPSVKGSTPSARAPSDSHGNELKAEWCNYFFWTEGMV